MKDKICSILRFLIRFFRLVLISLGGKKRLEGKKKDCACKDQSESETGEKAE